MIQMRNSGAQLALLLYQWQCHTATCSFAATLNSKLNLLSFTYPSNTFKIRVFRFIAKTQVFGGVREYDIDTTMILVCLLVTAPSEDAG